jgi:hypothetical protein
MEVVNDHGEQAPWFTASFTWSKAPPFDQWSLLGSSVYDRFHASYAAHLSPVTVQW